MAVAVSVVVAPERPMGVQDGQEDGEIDGKKFGEIIIIGECFRGSVKDRGKTV